MSDANTVELMVLRRLAQATHDIHRWNTNPGTNHDWSHLTEYRQRQAEALSEWLRLTADESDKKLSPLNRAKRDIQGELFEILVDQTHDIISQAREELSEAMSKPAPALAGNDDAHRQRMYERQRLYALEDGAESLSCALRRLREMRLHLTEAVKVLTDVRL